MEEEKIAKRGTMASEREIFNVCGPLHLTAIDCLVQGVYILERDRQLKRQGPEAQAPPWWDFFHFQLIHLLEDDVDHSIFGAIYEFKSFAFDYYNLAQNPPKYVIAFRGTIKKLDSLLRDVKLNLMCIYNRLHQSSRFQLAMQAVQNMVGLAGAASIWLAGHSLGSAIALLAGKNMTKMGCPIETYLFNPPFISAPIEIIKNQKVKHGIRFISNVVKAGLTVAVKGNHQRPLQNDPFVVLSAWVPYLFVNPADHICSEYIGYFEHRKKMEDIGAGKIERLATQISTWSLFSSILGSHSEESEPLHFLPSAYLTINLSKSPDFKRAHGIHQWWDPNFHSRSVVHQFM